MTDDERLEDLVLLWEEHQEAGRPVTVEELCRDCPELVEVVQRRIDSLGQLGWLANTRSGPRKHLILVPGAELIEGYRLVTLLGQGGFGQVWKATGPDGVEVALKFLPQAAQASQTEWKALEILRGIRHPHLLALLGYWETPIWLILGMELADASLYDRLLETPQGIPVGELLPLIRQAAACIDCLHESSLHHRDIKPHNLLLKEGIVKVADFGLARLVTHSITGHTGNMTMAYAAPEFFDGRTARHSDQYSLAVTYCQLRTGRLPFEGSAAQVIAGHLTKQPDLSMLSPAEREVVKKALSKRPESRWPSCTMFAEAIALAGEKGRSKTGSQGRLLRRCFIVGLLALPLSWWLFPQWQPHKALQNHIFRFDGASRIVTPVERFAPVTLETWIRPEGYSGGRFEKTIIGSDIPEHSGISLGFDFSSKAPDPLLGAQILPLPRAVSVPTGASLKLGHWAHVAAAFGETETVVFLDGKVVARGAASGREGGTRFVVGNAGESNRNHYFVGEIRTVRISRGVRYDTDFSPPSCFEPDESAVVIYDADNVQGEKVIDLSGKGNDGTIEGAKDLVRDLQE